jgi:hypothetical protein
MYATRLFESCAAVGTLLGNVLADLGNGIGMAIYLHCMRMADCARAFDCIFVVVNM